MRVPPLETHRLVIRPFVMDDLAAIHRILDSDLAGVPTGGSEGARTPAERRAWLQWTVLAYDQLASLHQPPYGERAITLRETGQVIGACGYVPCLDYFGQLPALRPSSDGPFDGTSTEFGLFWAVSPAHQRRGYATEAARSLIAYAFDVLGLLRVVATTSYDNEASIGVMRRAGMRIERNPSPNPPWLQVVGVLDRPRS